VNGNVKRLAVANGPNIFQMLLVTEIVLFSVVAFKTLDISQGSVAMHLRCGGILVVVLMPIFSCF